MIKSVNIQNFQSHKDTSLEFSPGVNIITGTSDSGKSALMRALRWVIENKPTGDGFRSSRGGDTAVQIDFKEGNSVKRGKTNKENTYQLNDSEPHKSVGKEIPKEIEKIINMTDVNVQKQIDRPFLISNTPGEVASHFNEVANLTQIDGGLRNINKWISTINTDIKYNTKSISETQEKLKGFSYLEDLEIDIVKLEKKQELAEEKGKQKKTLEETLVSLTETEDRIKSYANILQAEKTVLEALELDKKITGLKTAKSNLRKIVREINDCSSLIKKQEKYKGGEKLVDEVLVLMDKKKEVKAEMAGLKKIKLLVTTGEESIAKDKKYLKEIQTKLEDNMPDVCPLCETEL